MFKQAVVTSGTAVNEWAPQVLAVVFDFVEIFSIVMPLREVLQILSNHDLDGFTKHLISRTEATAHCIVGKHFEILCAFSCDIG